MSWFESLEDVWKSNYAACSGCAVRDELSYLKRQVSNSSSKQNGALTAGIKNWNWLLRELGYIESE